MDRPLTLSPAPTEQVAGSLEAEPELLPFVAELLADAWELGSDSAEVLGLLAPRLEANARVLDLGCGKGGVSVPLARELGVRVEAVDGHGPFVEEARRRAEEHGVSERCAFRVGDLRDAARREHDADAVLLLGVGDVLGDLRETVEVLRGCVRPGGWILIDDAFEEGAYEEPPTLEEARELLTAAGNELVAELVPDREALARRNARLEQGIRRRAGELATRRPDLAAALDAYVARQERENRRMQGPEGCALWLLRRAP